MSNLSSSTAHSAGLNRGSKTLQHSLHGECTSAPGREEILYIILQPDICSSFQGPRSLHIKLKNQHSSPPEALTMLTTCNICISLWLFVGRTYGPSCWISEHLSGSYLALNNPFPQWELGAFNVINMYHSNK